MFLKISLEFLRVSTILFLMFVFILKGKDNVGQ
jgi:hypothetical protein